MIRIVLTFGDSGLLETLTSQGHANRTNGNPSEACAGVSVLLRTAARLLSHADGIDAVGTAEEPGHLALKVKDVSDWRREWFIGVVDMVMLGLRDLESEFSGSIQIESNVRKR